MSITKEILKYKASTRRKKSSQCTAKGSWVVQAPGQSARWFLNECQTSSKLAHRSISFCASSATFSPQAHFPVIDCN